MMTTTTTTNTVRHLGACKRCKRAGRPHARRAECEVTTTRTESRTITLSGAEGYPRVSYRYTIAAPGERPWSTDDARHVSVACAACVAAGIDANGAQVLLTRVHGVTTAQKCGARCLASHGPVCECSCGGRNHSSAI